MKKRLRFSSKTIAELHHYVYALVDPRNGKIFYVGKASANNRAYDHLKSDVGETEKHQRVRDIEESGFSPRVEILRHGLRDEETCFEVEAAIIDAIGLEHLTNVVRGRGVLRGRQAASELERMYGAIPVDIADIPDSVILFFVSRSYSPTMSEVEIYDCVRQFWSGVGKERRTLNENGELPYRIALAVVDGVIVRAYGIAAWFPAGTTFSTRGESRGGNRWEFVGNSIQYPHVGKQLIEKGHPILATQQGYRYVN